MKRELQNQTGSYWSFPIPHFNLQAMQLVYFGVLRCKESLDYVASRPSNIYCRCPSNYATKWSFNTLSRFRLYIANCLHWNGILRYGTNTFIHTSVQSVLVVFWSCPVTPVIQIEKSAWMPLIFEGWHNLNKLNGSWLLSHGQDRGGGGYICSYETIIVMTPSPSNNKSDHSTYNKTSFMKFLQSTSQEVVFSAI